MAGAAGAEGEGVLMASPSAPGGNDAGWSIDALLNLIRKLDHAPTCPRYAAKHEWTEACRCGRDEALSQAAPSVEDAR